jgi:hypothetical protein
MDGRSNPVGPDVIEGGEKMHAHTLTKERTVEVTAGRAGLLTRARLALAGKVAAIASIVTVGLSGGIAGAVTTDPTGGATTTLSDEITGWATTYGVPMITAVIVVGIVIGLFIRYGRKAGKAAA